MHRLLLKLANRSRLRPSTAAYISLSSLPPQLTKYTCLASASHHRSLTHSVHRRNDDIVSKSRALDNNVVVGYEGQGPDSKSEDHRKLLVNNAKLISTLSESHKIDSHDNFLTLSLRPDRQRTSPNGSIQQVLGAWVDSVLDTARTTKQPTAILTEVTPNVFLRRPFLSKKGLTIVIELRRFSKGNSLSSELLENLTSIFQTIATINTVDAVVLSGGRAHAKAPVFCGGADVNELKSISKPDDAKSFINRVSNLCTAIRELPAPVIAAIDGPCIGAGLEVAASCDIRVATSASTFSMPEVHLAIPSVVEARLLCDIVGWGRSRHLLLTGCTWNANEAYEFGLITKKFDRRTTLFHWIAEFGKQCGAKVGVHKAQKMLIKEWEDSSIEKGIQAGVSAFAARFTHDLGSAVRHEMEAVIASRKARGTNKSAKAAKINVRNSVEHESDEKSTNQSLNDPRIRDEQPQ